MILLADSGTTKCDWIFVDNLQHDKHFEINTPGLNPTYHTENEIKGIINNSNDILKIKSHVETIYFFGSGCGEKKIQEKMKAVLSNLFYKCNEIHVAGDIDGAVYACTSENAVISILGTGSNSCYFNGKSIECRVPSLGYSIMDDGGGNAIGRECLRAYYYNMMSPALKKSFESQFKIDVEEVKHKLYKESNPSQYMSSFAPFVFDNMDESSMKAIVESEIERFFKTSLSNYGSELKKYPLHFVGSVAKLSEDILKSMCEKYQYNLGKVIQRPIVELAIRIDDVKKFLD